MGTLVRDPNALQIDFKKKKQTMEVGPWSRTMGKYHLPWSNFMVHDGVNQPLDPYFLVASVKEPNTKRPKI